MLEIGNKLRENGYLSNSYINFAVMSAINGVPLLVEGDPGVGKTSLAYATAKMLDLELLRVQFYDGLSYDKILYDYDYQKQLLTIQAIQGTIKESLAGKDLQESLDAAGKINFYGRDFLIERPILKAISGKKRYVLLLDEVEKASEEIEYTLLEVLENFSISIPQYGTVTCPEEMRPIVFLTSNRYRDLSAPWDEKQAGCLYQTLIKQAEKSLYDGDLEQADAMMDISKELSSAITKRQKNTAELESAISQAQEETDQQIKKLQRQMKDEQRRYEDTCRELDRAFEQMKRGMDSSNDSLTIKPSSVIHRADFIDGGSIQTMNAEFVRLSEKPFKKLTEAEKNQMREYLRQNLLAFKTRMTRNINSKRRLSLNLEETMRESIRTCGQPINLIYKQPRRSKADLVLILDVSGSCKDASEMMLTFIGLLKEVFPRGCSAFAFVNSLYDISRVYDTEDVDNAAKQILTMIPRSGQYSNYERPLRSMWKEYRNRISKDSMIIFIGDARNNKNDAGENYIKNIC